MFFNLKVDRTEWDVGRKEEGQREREEEKERGNRVEDRKQSSAARLTTERL